MTIPSSTNSVVVQCGLNSICRGGDLSLLTRKSHPSPGHCDKLLLLLPKVFSLRHTAEGFWLVPTCVQCNPQGATASQTTQHRDSRTESCSRHLLLELSAWSSAWQTLSSSPWSGTAQRLGVTTATSTSMRPRHKHTTQPTRMPALRKNHRC